MYNAFLQVITVGDDSILACKIWINWMVLQETEPELSDVKHYGLLVEQPWITAVTPAPRLSMFWV